MNHTKIRGVGCAVATPFNADYSVDISAMVDHCRALLDDGVHYLAVLGTTGEANSLSVAERMDLLERLIAAGLPANLFLPGTGVCSFSETVCLTRHAHDLGVSGVVMLPPFYYKDPSEDALVKYYETVADLLQGDAPNIILYNIPQMSTVAITPALVKRLRARFADLFVGIKDSSGEAANTLSLIRDIPSLAVFPGPDALMWPLLAEGSAGCITATSNLIGKELAALFDDPARGDAQQIQDRIVAMRELSLGGYQIARVKAMIAVRHGYKGWKRTRPPMMPVSETEFAALNDRADFIRSDSPLA